MLAQRERVYRAAYRVLADREEALDSAQEAFLELHERLGEVPEERVGAWLVRVVTHRSIDRLRRRARGRSALSALPDPQGAPAAEAVAASAEERARLLAALGELSARQRDVLTLRVWEQLTFRQVAQELGISEGAAKVFFRRGLTALRRRLGGVVSADER